MAPAPWSAATRSRYSARFRSNTSLGVISKFSLLFLLSMGGLLFSGASTLAIKTAPIRRTRTYSARACAHHGGRDDQHRGQRDAPGERASRHRQKQRGGAQRRDVAQDADLPRIPALERH